MDYKKEIEKLLKALKNSGHDRATIEERLGYAENALDQSLARNGSKKLFKALSLYQDWVLKNSTPGQDGNKNERQEPSEGVDKLRDVIAQLMQTQNSILVDQKKHLVDKVERISSNSDITLEAVEMLRLRFEFAAEVTLESLARLEKKPIESLKQEAGNRLKRFREGNKTRGNEAGAGI